MKLEKEKEIFDSRRKEFCLEHEGKFAVLKNNEVLGFFDTETDAFTAGIGKYGFDSFLIEEV